MRNPSKNCLSGNNSTQRPNPPKWVNTPLQNYKPHSILVEKLEEPKECYTTSSTLPKICKRKLRS